MEAEPQAESVTRLPKGAPDKCPIVIENCRKVVPGLAVIGKPSHTGYVISVYVVRPDDNAFTQLPLDVCNQIGKCARSKTSAKMIPAAANFLVNISPGGSAQITGVTFRHQSSL